MLLSGGAWNSSGLASDRRPAGVAGYWYVTPLGPLQLLAALVILMSLLTLFLG